MMQTRAGIVAAYHEEGVNVSLDNGHILCVTFVNSGFNNIQSEEERKTRAREIAKVAKGCCPHIDQIDAIYVSFAVESDYLILHTNHTSTFSFTKAELGP